MLYLLRDDFFGEKRLAELRAAVGPPDVQSLNVSVLDGPRLTLPELRAAAEALPFLGDRRLIIVRRLFGAGPARGESDGEAPETRRGKADAERERDLLAYLPRVPETTDLVLVEDSSFKAAHPAAVAIRKAGGQVLIADPPAGDQLVEWIFQQVRGKGGRIERGAAEELAGLSFIDLRHLDSVLDTLLTYADTRAVTGADVRALVPQSHDVTVFALVDAVGGRDRRSALEAYRRLLADGVSPIYLLVMLTRQMRLLLLASEAQRNGEDLASALKVPSWVGRKLGQQARAFGVDRCLAAFRRLAATDQAIKTGEALEEVAVELLLVELTER